MAYDEYILDRIRLILKEKNVTNFYEKRMMGGLIIMIDDKMCFGTHYSKKQKMDLIMARIGESAATLYADKEGCLPMDFTGRPMKGYVFISPDGYDTDEDLSFWIQLALDFNPLAKASKKRTKK